MNSTIGLRLCTRCRRSRLVAQGFADANVPAFHVLDELDHIGSHGCDARGIEAVLIPQRLHQFNQQRWRALASLGPERFEAFLEGRVRFFVAIRVNARL